MVGISEAVAAIQLTPTMVYTLLVGDIDHIVIDTIHKRHRRSAAPPPTQQSHMGPPSPRSAVGVRWTRVFGCVCLVLFTVRVCFH